MLSTFVIPEELVIVLSTLPFFLYSLVVYPVERYVFYL